MKQLTLFMALVITLTGCSQMTDKKNEAPTKAGVNPTQFEYAFTQAGQHPEKMLIDVINSAKSSLDIAIYSLTHKDIVNAILEAKKRGVALRIITDHQEAQNKSQAEELKKLQAVGIPIKENTRQRTNALEGHDCR